ncbi:hypothetical protein Cthe_3306 [Acetivibrio thermocellus ATCC 27405]|uniref:Uncharacterized protein n=1 Tax=Acetivibrio thermocellus (strain ATCC 27405 / DSM 1237 / JCM 9322 / NBRC 103400 / NCIMB 10682 / NRRL B-4536 / VPI 7372) TaxID=203119 RepID=G2JC63_ACET2|nr:hypothetical protein Cthe_3306 [Acetivibrio thermocellus ATCC 27405]
MILHIMDLLTWYGIIKAIPGYFIATYITIDILLYI